VSLLLLSAEELCELTGYTRAADQLRALLAQGFYRARRNRLGDVVLERAHYDAVCAARPTLAGIEDRPPVRPLRRAA
jgi:hypothetical protein